MIKSLTIIPPDVFTFFTFKRIVNYGEYEII